MWTSRAGDGYISLTAHYITDDFEFCHQNEVSETDGEVVEVEEPEKEAIVEYSATPKNRRPHL